jgi:hypothetical protein
MVQLLRHRQTKGSATDRLHLNHRVTPRLHTCPVPELHFSGNGVDQASEYFRVRCHAKSKSVHQSALSHGGERLACPSRCRWRQARPCWTHPHTATFDSIARAGATGSVIPSFGGEVIDDPLELAARRPKASSSVPCASTFRSQKRSMAPGRRSRRWRKHSERSIRLTRLGFCLDV